MTDFLAVQDALKEMVDCVNGVEAYEFHPGTSVAGSRAVFHFSTGHRPLEVYLSFHGECHELSRYMTDNFVGLLEHHLDIEPSTNVEVSLPAPLEHIKARFYGGLAHGVRQLSAAIRRASTS